MIVVLQAQACLRWEVIGGTGRRGAEDRLGGVDVSRPKQRHSPEDLQAGLMNLTPAVSVLSTAGTRWGAKQTATIQAAVEQGYRGSVGALSHERACSTLFM